MDTSDSDFFHRHFPHCNSHDHLANSIAFGCQARPCGHGFRHAIHDGVGAADAELPGHGQEVLPAEAVPPAVDAHLMLMGIFAGWVICPDHVKSRAETPLTLAIHEKSDIACVVVLVARQYVECHTPEEFLHGRIAQIKSLDDLQGLLVTVLAGRVKIVMGHGAQ